MLWMYQSSKDFFEDLKKLSLLNFSVSGFVDSLNKLCDLLLGDLSVGFHVVEGIVDEVGDFSDFQGAVFISIVFAEHCIYCLSELIVAI